MKALVVENSDTLRAVLRRLLTMRGFEVTEAADSQRALDAINGIGATDLALIDWNVKSGEDLALISRLRLESQRDTTIIVLAQAEPGVREFRRALIAGANDYLLKPFTAQQIDEKLARAGIEW